MTEAILNIREIVEKEAARAVDKCLSERINQKTAEECTKSKFKITPEGNLTFETVAESILEAKNPKAAEEFTKCIAKMLSKNGAKVMMTEYEYNGGYGVAFEGLDFSEHDKVLKSEILKLKEKVEDCEEDFEIAAREADKLYAENQSLKQRIAELESKGTEKLTKINLNDRIKVKLTPLGADIYYHQHDEIKGDYPKIEKYLTSKLPRVDDEGYTEFQLHHFIELYGGYIGMGKKNVIEPLDIIVSE